MEVLVLKLLILGDLTPRWLYKVVETIILNRFSKLDHGVMGVCGDPNWRDFIQVFGSNCRQMVVLGTSLDIARQMRPPHLLSVL